MKPGDLVLYTPPPVKIGDKIYDEVCRPYLGFILEKHEKHVKVHWLEYNQTGDFDIISPENWVVIS